MNILPIKEVIIYLTVSNNFSKHSEEVDTVDKNTGQSIFLQSKPLLN
jgi:hypothetical protein